jgi:hypothetical protein
MGRLIRIKRRGISIIGHILLINTAYLFEGRYVFRNPSHTAAVAHTRISTSQQFFLMAPKMNK